MRLFSVTSPIETIVPSTGEYTSVPAAAPTSIDEVAGPWPPGRWYQRGGLRRRPGPAEGGKEQGHQRDHEDRDEHCKAAETTLAFELAAMRARSPVLHRGRHGGQRSGRFLRFQRKCAICRPIPSSSI